MFDWPHRQRVLPRDLEGYKQLYADTLDCLEDKCAELAALRAENDRLKDLLRDWCSVPWQHKTPEMLERTRAALERPA